jgi:hypothetical protein
MKYVKSKNVKDGLIVTIRANKIILCNKMSMAIGVYKEGFTQKALDMDGNKIIISIPERIVYWGPTEIFSDINRTFRSGKNEV